MILKDLLRVINNDKIQIFIYDVKDLMCPYFENNDYQFNLTCKIEESLLNSEVIDCLAVEESTFEIVIKKGENNV